jgi:hypothetical protein
MTQMWKKRLEWTGNDLKNADGTYINVVAYSWLWPDERATAKSSRATYAVEANNEGNRLVAQYDEQSAESIARGISWFKALYQEYLTNPTQKNFQAVVDYKKKIIERWRPTSTLTKIFENIDNDMNKYANVNK